MPFQRGTSLAPVILQTAQVLLHANQQRRQAEAQQQELEFKRQQLEERAKYQEQLLKAREEKFQLDQEIEKRRASQGDAKIRNEQRGMDIREAIGMGNLDVAQRRITLQEALGKFKMDGSGKGDKKTAMEEIKYRKAKMQEIEEDAAIRDGAPDAFQSYSDTDKLLRYKAQREAALDGMKRNFVQDTDPRVKEIQGELGAIGQELQQRAIYKRRSLLEAGIVGSLDQVKNHLPNLVQETSVQNSTEEANKETTSLGGFDFSDEGVFEKTVGSATGLSTDFEIRTAQNAIRTELKRLQGSGDPTKVNEFMIRMLRSFPGSMSVEDRKKKLQSIIR